MKYIVGEVKVADDLIYEKMFVFPNNFVHEIMAQHTEQAIVEHGWELLEWISAGEINSLGSCHGLSTTMKLESRPDLDTNLFMMQDYGVGIV